MGKFIDLTGKRFGRLTVVERVSPKGTKHIKYKCLCDCGNYCEVTADCLRYGDTISCGCFRKEVTSCLNKQRSKKISYKHISDYVVGDDGSGHQFKIDKESYPKISKYHWIYAEGYWVRSVRNKDGSYSNQRMHHFLMPNVSENTIIDHANMDKSDNRKCNLRVADYSLNGANCGLRSTNKSGIVGVWYNKKSEKWCAGITVKGKSIWLGQSTNKEEAILARLKGEAKYFGKFAPQRILFEQYGIEVN